jgi:hypothetical protein
MTTTPRFRPFFCLLAILGLLAGCTSSTTTSPPAVSTIQAVTSSGPSVSAPTTSAAATSETNARRTSGAPRTTAGAPTTSPAQCPLPTTGFDCDFQRRIVATQRYIATRPGTVGIVLRDRITGAVWRNQYASTPVWTASTIKLAMTVDLYTRSRAGLITLSDQDRTLIQEMLHSSDDNAADTLWFRYAGTSHFDYNNRFPLYGLTSLVPQRGFTNYFPYWGFQKCTPNDLDRLMDYVLTKLDASDRRYIVDQLQHVATDQQWGVWGSGPAAKPGNKDGWSLEQSGWVLNSIGFVGPNQRYTLAVMNSLNGRGGYDDGTTTDSHVAALLFSGRF